LGLALSLTTGGDLSTDAYETDLAEIREGNRHLATISGVLQGGYFAAISIGDLKQTLPLGVYAPMFAPMLFWALTLVISVWVMLPSPRESRWEGKGSHEQQRQKRLDRLRKWWKVSTASFLIGVVLMAGAILYYVFGVQLPAAASPLIAATACP
jgi:hypothetical protein